MGEEDEVGMPGELDRATEALDEAYQGARATGYRAGSPQMQALELAEWDYRRARRRHWRARTQHPERGGDREDTLLDLREDNQQQIDLRDPVTHYPRPPAPQDSPPTPRAGEPG